MAGRQNNTAYGQEDSAAKDNSPYFAPTGWRGLVESRLLTNFYSVPAPVDVLVPGRKLDCVLLNAQRNSCHLAGAGGGRSRARTRHSNYSSESRCRPRLFGLPPDEEVHPPGPYGSLPDTSFAGLDSVMVVPSESSTGRLATSRSNRSDIGKPARGCRKPRSNAAT